MLKEKHLKKIIRRVLSENYQSDMESYNELKNLLYRVWDKLKERGISPKLDGLTYDLADIKKDSDLELHILLPIWFEYNGGFEKVYKEYLDSLVGKKFNITESIYDLDMNILILDVELYIEEFSVGLEVEVQESEVNGYILNDEGESIEMRMTVQDQLSELEYDSQDFEIYLTENIKNTLNGVFEEKYGITISYVRLV
jgi:hypothetical protein